MTKNELILKLAITYRLDPLGEGDGVFEYWDQNNVWPALRSILQKQFVQDGNFMLAPPQHTTNPDYDGYRAGIANVDGSWKFAYFVRNEPSSVPANSVKASSQQESPMLCSTLRMKVKELTFTVIGISVIFAVAGILMFLFHFWKLPLIEKFLPLIRGSVGLFLGGLAFFGAHDLRRNNKSPCGPIVYACLIITILTFLLSIYAIPIYCDYVHARNIIQKQNPNKDEAKFFAEIRTGGFPAYIRAVGHSALPLDVEELPEGDKLSDLLIILVYGVDQLLQKLCIAVLHLPIAGYVSLTIWYCVFAFISFLGRDLFWHDRC